MTYEDQVAIGTVFNEAIQRVLVEYGVSEQYGIYGSDIASLVSSIAQEILLTLDLRNYQIVRK